MISSTTKNLSSTSSKTRHQSVDSKLDLSSSSTEPNRIRRQSPNMSHRGEGDQTYLPSKPIPSDQPVPSSPDPMASDTAANTGIDDDFVFLDQRNWSADERMDQLLKHHAEEKALRAEREAHQRIYGSRTLETQAEGSYRDSPSKTRSRSPSTRNADVMTDTQPIGTFYQNRRISPRSNSPSYSAYERDASLAERRRRGEVDKKFRQLSRPASRTQPLQVVAASPNDITPTVTAASLTLSPFSVSEHDISVAAAEASKYQGVLASQQRAIERLSAESNQYQNMIG